MTRVIRLFVLIEGITFIIAALTHFGVLIGGYEHHLAGRAESVIGIVLLAGLALTWIRPAWTRGIGLAVQAFALFGNLRRDIHDRRWYRPPHGTGCHLSRLHRDRTRILPDQDRTIAGR